MGIKLNSFILILSVFIAVGCSTSSGGKRAKKPDVKRNKLGYVLPKYNFSIDAQYNHKLASLIPGYTTITVAVANKGFNQIFMRPDKDKWKIRGRDSGWHRAFSDIQYQEPAEWDQLSPRTKQMITYPEAVPPGYTQTFSIFIPGEVNLAGFTEIKYHNAAMGKTFTFTRY